MPRFIRDDQLIEFNGVWEHFPAQVGDLLELQPNHWYEVYRITRDPITGQVDVDASPVNRAAKVHAINDLIEGSSLPALGKGYLKTMNHLFNR
jgi:hypothetical protein